MDKNLFLSLLKYKSSESLTPLENFTTQLFAYLLDNIKNFRNRFLKLIQINVFDIEELALNVETQRSDGGVIPDISIIDAKGKIKIFVENKIDAPLFLKQLENYISLAENSDEGEVVSITKFPKTFPLKRYKSLTWKKIHDISEETLKDNLEQKNSFLLKEFNNFLVNIGVIPMYKRIEKNFIKPYDLILFLKDCIRETVYFEEEVFRPSFAEKWYGFSFAFGRYNIFCGLYFGHEYYKDSIVFEFNEEEFRLEKAITGAFNAQDHILLKGIIEELCEIKKLEDQIIKMKSEIKTKLIPKMVKNFKQDHGMFEHLKNDILRNILKYSEDYDELRPEFYGDLKENFIGFYLPYEDKKVWLGLCYKEKEYSCYSFWEYGKTPSERFSNLISNKDRIKYQEKYGAYSVIFENGDELTSFVEKYFNK